jgi:hypothetical protein
MPDKMTVGVFRDKLAAEAVRYTKTYHLAQDLDGRDEFPELMSYEEWWDSFSAWHVLQLLGQDVQKSVEGK